MGSSASSRNTVIQKEVNNKSADPLNNENDISLRSSSTNVIEIEAHHLTNEIHSDSYTEIHANDEVVIMEEPIAVGLLNPAGKNNCFLNCTIQILWHLDCFRKNFNLLHGHDCSESSCIFCALKVIFTQFQFSEQSAIPPDALRTAMASAFANEHRFQLGYMEDAAECYEHILSCIHDNLNNTAENQCSARHCISHSKFSMQLEEKTIYKCKCHLPVEVVSFDQFVYYVSTSALIQVSKQSRDMQFGQRLRTAKDVDGCRQCPSSGCSEKVQTQCFLTSSPEVISIGFVWDSSESSSRHISDLVHTIDRRIHLSHLFDSIENGKDKKSEDFHLVALVCYYGKHYSVFLYEEQFQMWICCDDSTISEIGSDLKSVVDKCCKGHYQPLLLLYANRYSSPINTNKAMKNVRLVTNQHLNTEKPARLSSARPRSASSRKKDSILPNGNTSGRGDGESQNLQQLSIIGYCNESIEKTQKPQPVKIILHDYSEKDKKLTVSHSKSFFKGFEQPPSNTLF